MPPSPRRNRRCHYARWVSNATRRQRRHDGGCGTGACPANWQAKSVTLSSRPSARLRPCAVFSRVRWRRHGRGTGQRRRVVMARQDGGNGLRTPCSRSAMATSCPVEVGLRQLAPQVGMAAIFDRTRHRPSSHALTWNIIPPASRRSKRMDVNIARYGLPVGLGAGIWQGDVNICRMGQSVTEKSAYVGQLKGHDGRVPPGRGRSGFASYPSAPSAAHGWPRCRAHIVGDITGNIVILGYQPRQSAASWWTRSVVRAADADSMANHRREHAGADNRAISVLEYSAA